MINEKLMKRFEQIEDLPVSEEMLGAYIEGNLDQEEINDIKFIIEDSRCLQEILDTEFIGLSCPEPESQDNFYDSECDLPFVSSGNFINFDATSQLFLQEDDFYDTLSECPIENSNIYKYDEHSDYILDNSFEDDDFTLDFSDDDKDIYYE